MSPWWLNISNDKKHLEAANVGQAAGNPLNIVVVIYGVGRKIPAIAPVPQW